MIELYSSGQPVDLVTLQNKLREKDVPQEVSSLEFVGELVRAVPTSANVKYYCNIVKENSMKRKLIRVTEEIEMSAMRAKNRLKVFWIRPNMIFCIVVKPYRRRLCADPSGCHERTGKD